MRNGDTMRTKIAAFLQRESRAAVRQAVAEPGVLDAVPEPGVLRAEPGRGRKGDDDDGDGRSRRGQVHSIAGARVRRVAAPESERRLALR